MGTHASKRGVKPHPLQMDLPVGLDIYVDGRLGSVSTLMADLYNRTVYRRRHNGRFDRLAMVDGLTTVIEGHHRRVYVEWRLCRRHRATNTFV